MDEQKQIEGKMWVNRQYRKSGVTMMDDTEERRILVDIFQTTPAMVTAGTSLTINLGNYESMKVSVTVSIPCYKEEIHEALDYAFKIAEGECISRTNEIKEQL